MLLVPVLLEADGDGVPTTTESCVDEEGLILVPVLLDVDDDGVPTTTEFCVDGEGLLAGDGTLLLVHHDITGTF